jgi:hypothetical protein
MMLLTAIFETTRENAIITTKSIIEVVFVISLSLGKYVPYDSNSKRPRDMSINNSTGYGYGEREKKVLELTVI